MKLTSKFKANPRRGLVAILHTLLQYKKADPAESGHSCVDERPSEEGNPRNTLLLNS